MHKPPSVLRFLLPIPPLASPGTVTSNSWPTINGRASIWSVTWSRLLSEWAVHTHACFTHEGNDGLMTSTRQNKESTKGVLAEPLEYGYILHGRTTYSHSVKFLQSDYMLFYHAVYIPLVISLLSAISSVSCSVFCSSEVAGKNSFSSNWKWFCFCNRVIYFPPFIFSYVTSVLFISVFKSICNASWS